MDKRSKPEDEYTGKPRDDGGENEGVGVHEDEVSGLF
jgi:hypothetical protein